MVNLLFGGFLTGGIYALMAIGLSIVFSIMKISNFAHGEFYMLGAYGLYFARVLWGFSPIFCFIIVALEGFLIGALVDKLTFSPMRKRSKSDWMLNTFLLTAGVAVIFRNLAQIFFGAGYLGVTHIWSGVVKILDMNLSIDRLMSFFIAMGVILIFWVFLKKTKQGNAILAVGENEEGAMLMGIDLSKIHTLTFALSSMLAFIAGGSLISITSAYPSMGRAVLSKSWFIIILMGTGNIQTTIIGGFIVGIIEAVATYSFGQSWQEVILLSIIILVLIFKPSGLFGKSLKV